MFLTPENLLKDLKILFSKASILIDPLKDPVKVSKLSGLTNTVFKIESRMLKYPLLLHVFSKDFKLFITHDFENDILIKLSEKNLYSKIYHFDECFRLSEFYEGNQISPEDLLNRSDILNGFLFRLSCIHELLTKEKKFLLNGACLDNLIDNSDFLLKINMEISERMEDMDTVNKKKIAEMFQKVFSKEIQNKFLEILREIKLIHIKNGLPIEFLYSFCHNDLNNTNIIIQNQKNPLSLRIIDYEYSSYNYLSYEFANLFNEMAMDYSYSDPPYFFYNKSKYPDKQFRMNLIGIYMFYRRSWVESNFVGNKLAENFDKDLFKNTRDKEIEAFCQENFQIIDSFEKMTSLSLVFSHYFWMMIAGLSLNKKDIGLDLFEYILMRFEFINELLI